MCRAQVGRDAEGTWREGLWRLAKAEGIARGIDPQIIADALRVDLDGLAMMEAGRVEMPVSQRRRAEAALAIDGSARLISSSPQSIEPKRSQAIWQGFVREPSSPRMADRRVGVGPEMVVYEARPYAPAQANRII
jgi:hypothetical protein